MEKEEFNSYIKAGKIAQEIKKFVIDFVKPKMKLIEIAKAIDNKIFELGGKSAFPVNLSLNEIAAHFTPENNCEIIAEGLLKIDIGVAINGFIADTAISLDLTEDKRYENMITLNKKILENATKSVKIDMEVKDVGENTAVILKEWNEKNKTNYSIIKELCGHTLDKNTIHAGLTISNYKNNNHTKLNEIAFAIEPFVTTGNGDIYEGSPGGIYCLKSIGNARDRDAREILTFIKENYGSTPFCIRWLEDKNFKKIKFSLSTLEKQGIIYQYPMLIEKSKGIVSQVENTFLIANGEVANTTKYN
jgi:methionyl aminopeptidase